MCIYFESMFGAQCFVVKSIYVAQYRTEVYKLYFLISELQEYFKANDTQMHAE